MIRDVVLSIETFMMNNWTATEIHYEDTEMIPTSTDWIHLQIVPTTSDIVSINGCQEDRGAVIVTAYGENKGDAGTTIDSVSSLFINGIIGNIRFSGVELLSSGSLDTSYFYKVAYRYIRG